MLRFFLPSLLVLFLGTCGRAQTLPITYQKQLIGYRFMYDNLLIQPPNFQRAMALDPEARAVMSGSGLLEAGGVLVGAYGASVAITALLIGDGDGLDQRLDGRGYYIAGGLVGTGLGLWMVHLADKKRVRAVDVYNNNLKMPTTYRPSVRARVTENGVGIGLRF